LERDKTTTPNAEIQHRKEVIHMAKPTTKGGSTALPSKPVKNVSGNANLSPKKGGKK
jgi:hypothetical protein